MTDIDTLIRDLERATEGSRELDKEIADLIIGPDRSGDALYTGSVDAALTLVPEGYSTALTIHPGGVHTRDDPPVTFAHVYRVRNEEGEWDHGEHEARMDMETAHPALALCIAALKARSAP